MLFVSLDTRSVDGQYSEGGLFRVRRYPAANGKAPFALSEKK